MDKNSDTGDPIKQIAARYQEEQEVTFADDEETIIEDFCNYVLTNDPDILISTKQAGQVANPCLCDIMLMNVSVNMVLCLK